MSQPFVYIGTYKLKDGGLEAFRQACTSLVELVEANEPRLIAFNFYANEERDEVSVVQVHPDADSMLFHMQLLDEHISNAFDEESPLDVTLSEQIYGLPSTSVLEMIEGYNAAGAPVNVKPVSLGGFTRSAAQDTVSAGA